MDEPIMRRGLCPEGKKIREKHQGSLHNYEFGVTSLPMQKSIEKNYIKENVLRWKEIQAKCKEHDLSLTSNSQPMKATRQNISSLPLHQDDLISGNGPKSSNLSKRNTNVHSKYYLLCEKGLNDSTGEYTHTGKFFDDIDHSSNILQCSENSQQFTDHQKNLETLYHITGTETVGPVDIHSSKNTCTKSLLQNNDNYLASCNTKKVDTPNCPKCICDTCKGIFYDHRNCHHICSLPDRLSMKSSRCPGQGGFVISETDCFSACHLEPSQVCNSSLRSQSLDRIHLKGCNSQCSKVNDLDQRVFSGSRCSSVKYLDSSIGNLDRNIDQFPSFSGDFKQDNCLSPHPQDSLNTKQSRVKNLNANINLKEEKDIDKPRQVVATCKIPLDNLISPEISTIKDHCCCCTALCKSLEDYKIDDKTEVKLNNVIKKSVSCQTTDLPFIQKIKKRVPPKRELKGQEKSKVTRPGQPPSSYVRGQLPKYLQARKANAQRLKEVAANVDPNCPPDHSLLPDHERRNTLHLLKKGQAEIMRKLSSLPLMEATQRSKQLRTELESKLNQIEEALKIFTQPKVYVSNEEKQE